jgi:hypothetical protein
VRARVPRSRGAAKLGGADRRTEIIKSYIVKINSVVLVVAKLG